MQRQPESAPDIIRLRCVGFVKVMAEKEHVVGKRVLPIVESMSAIPLNVIMLKIAVEQFLVKLLVDPIEKNRQSRN
jgi:hypothetical protein